MMMGRSMKKMANEEIEKIFLLLDEREKTILKMRFGIGSYEYQHTLKEIGKFYHLTRGRIHQIEVNALEKLLHCEELRKFGGEEIKRQNNRKKKLENIRNKLLDVAHKVRRERNCKNGKQEGITKIYYKGGKLRREVNYKNDKREGLAKIYYKNGKLWGKFNYENNKREGLAKIYYKSG